MTDWHAGIPMPPLSLFFVTPDGTRHRLDGDRWDPASLTGRDRALCGALLEYALQRIHKAEVEETHPSKTEDLAPEDRCAACDCHPHPAGTTQ